MNRAAVREVADLYFERFSARLDKDLAEVRAELAGFRADWEKGLGGVRAEMALFRTDWEKGLAAVRTDLEKGLAAVRADLAVQRADLIKWMFIFWAGTVAPLAGLLVALTKF